MPLTIKHTFVSPKLDSSDPTIVRPSAWNDAHEVTGGGFMLAGTIIDFVGVSWPSYMLECYGQSVSATTYPFLFAAMVKQFNVTFTMGTPGIVNWTAHGIPINGKVRFRTTGNLPAGITQNVDYYVLPTGYSANTFTFSETVGGTAIALSTGTMSGAHTGVHAPYGATSDLSTFSLPDLRGRVTAGLDIMGGADADRLTGIAGSVNGAILGATGGAEGAVAAVPEHTHSIDAPSAVVVITVDSSADHTHVVTGTISGAADHTHAASGGIIGDGGSHSHTFSSGITSGESADHSHTQQGRQYGATYGGAGGHTHYMYDAAGYYERALKYQGGTNRSGVQPSNEGGGSGIAIGTTTNGAHEHSVYVDIGGATSGRNVGHTHTVTGTISTAPAHTHALSGLSIAAGGAHTHTFSSGSAASAGAHTHTASGTVDIGAFTSGITGSSAAHNNVQPTFIVRKLIFVG